MKSKPQRLTEKQERFCRHYLDTSNMQPNSVWNAASLLLDNPKVTQRIDETCAGRAAVTFDEYG